MPRKLVLVVVDAMHPEMLLRAIDEDQAPTFGALVERGQIVTDVRLQLPLGHPGGQLGDDDRRSARPATG